MKIFLTKRFKHVYSSLITLLTIFFILIVNLIYDILMVGIIKSDLKQKLENKRKLKNKSQSRSENNDIETKIKNEMKKKNSIERKANAMILVTVAIYKACRLPELTGVFLQYFFHSIFYYSCQGQLICYVISNLTEYIYMYSYCFNIIIYYKFNSFFNKGFKNFFSRWIYSRILIRF